MEAHSEKPLADREALIRNWKRWEAGDAEPNAFHKPLIARAFGTVTAALFPKERPARAEAELLLGAGMGTLEIVARLRASDVSMSTLDALQITADQLCIRYRTRPHLICWSRAGSGWVGSPGCWTIGSPSASTVRCLTSPAGFALLVGCVEYDTGDGVAAEASRKAALLLGVDAGNSSVVGWAHEMRAWFALTQGDYRAVIAASNAGAAAAPGQGVAVQLAAQRAKAWARCMCSPSRTWPPASPVSSMPPPRCGRWSSGSP
jgi:hypothetical protein